MRIRERYELAAELGERYRAARRQERGEILNSFCLASGYNRKYAMTMLAGRTRVKGPIRRPRARRYEGQAFRLALALVWEASGYICAERLKPFLMDLVQLLEKHHQLKVELEIRRLLEEISVTTLRRRLASMRPATIWNPRLLRPPQRLKGLVPIVFNNLKVFETPGHLEIDLVSHSGRYATGEWIYTLTAVDLCTGWVELAAVMSKAQREVLAGIEKIRQGLPFRVLSLHIDNGHEFLNDRLIGYCGRRGIQLGRGRVHRSNDHAHVEQKNGYLVRGLLADHRLDSAEQLEWLTDLYVLTRPFVNCFQPVMKRIGQVHRGDRSQRIHDQPRTPLQRLLESGAVEPDSVAELVELYTEVSPLTLRRRIEEHLAKMPRALLREPGRNGRARLPQEVDRAS
jgi:transposase InsO family protein